MRARIAAAAPMVVGLGVLVTTAALVPHGILNGHGMADTGLYRQYGVEMAHGAVPYRDFFIEFPPGALPALVAPALVGGHDHYVLAFKLLQALLLGVAVMSTVMTVRTLGRSVLHQAAAGAFVGATPALLGPISVNAFDAWPAALVSVGLLLVARAHVGSGTAILGLGTAAKLYPALLAPVIMVGLHRGRSGRAARLGAVGWIIGGALATVPFLLAAPGGLGFSLRTQLTRGLQVESLGGSILLGLDVLGARAARIVTATPHSFDIAGGVARGVGALSTLLQVIAVLAPAAILQRRHSVSLEQVVLAVAAATAGLLAVNKVISPQYLVWLIPAIAACRLSAAWVLTAGAALLTRVWFPDRFESLVHGGNVALVVVLRNVTLVALYSLLIRQLASKAKPQEE